MLTCAATCRSRDKKPDDNRMDAVPAGAVSITEINERIPAENIVMMKTAANARNAVTIADAFAGTGLTVGQYVDLERQTALAMELTGEPEIAAFRSNADRHSGLIR